MALHEKIGAGGQETMKTAPSKLVVLLCATWTALICAQTRECDWDMQCEELYQAGSKCMDDGRCSNPFMSGCLYNHRTQLSTWNETDLPDKRACNSDDLNLDSCSVFPLNYSEVRVHNGDWESPIFYSWIIQIFLSEYLQVPVTVGLSPEDTSHASFYNPSSEMTWSTQAYAFDEILKANDMKGRCDLTSEQCVHVMPEVWIGQEKKWKEFLAQGHIDQVNGDGQVGKISWYIPFHTARRYPQLSSYHGLAGRREELASIFNRPTTWKDYCSEVSRTACLEPDGVAARVPEKDEEDMYFAGSDFMGHFRPTIKNNCNVTINCTGHIVGAPCTWSNNIEAQTYHNNIALESDGPLPENGGYSYNQMIQIWRAANATSSDVLMWWWTPDATIEEFRGTSYEFQQVLLPEPTLQCREASIEPIDRCSTNRDTRRGDPLGGCDNEANALQKVIATSLREMTYETPEVDRSPGYQAILNLMVSHLDMNTMLHKWVVGGRSGYAARKAVCEWVIEHQEDLESFIPRGYPRVFVDVTSYNVPLLHAATAVGAIAVVIVLVVFGVVYYYSDTKVFVYAQVPFIFMVLLGLLLVACGSIFFAMEPQDPTCVSQVWLMTLGYTLELVPLLVKVAAINRMMNATKRMRRVRISMRTLFCTVASLVLLVVIFLAVWTALDPPHRQEGRYLVQENEFEIVTTVGCASDSGVWDLVVVCWNGLLIVCATVLAFQSRSIKQEFNESRSLGTMIYSHFVFAVLRTITFNLEDSSFDATGYPTLDPSIVAAASSFLLSFDVMTSVSIYIIPKIAAARNAPQPHDTSTLGNSDTSGSKNPCDDSSLKIVDEGPTRLARTTSRRDCRLDSNSSSTQTNASRSARETTGRLCMDGTIRTHDNDDSSSSDDMDYGGPRFTVKHTGSSQVGGRDTGSPTRGYASSNQSSLVGISTIEEDE